jgi:sarcosine oxidase
MPREAQFSRRTLLLGGTVMAASTLGSKQATRAAMRIAVVGAGAFGGWTALHLLRSGAKVTLVDAWGPGNSRASSGGETRVIRHGYGRNRVYVESVLRALELWRENQAKWGLQLLHPVGVLWMAGEDDAFERASVPLMEEVGARFDELTTKELSRRFPQLNVEGVRWAMLEHDAGYLLARRGCAAVLDAFVAEGGTFRQAAVKPASEGEGTLRALSLTDGSAVEADQYVFACGPWLGRLFPEALGELIHPTRQEVYYFGPPPGEGRYDEDRFPCWMSPAPSVPDGPVYYGIPGNQYRGFKIANDARGPAFDPTTGDRTPTPAGIEAARAYVGYRFPGLGNAPLVEARVCQYEQITDGNFILDRHPKLDNVWIAGGGSGHGYKHGPAVGERVTALVLGKAKVDPFFSFSRF